MVQDYSPHGIIGSFYNRAPFYGEKKESNALPGFKKDNEEKKKGEEKADKTG